MNVKSKHFVGSYYIGISQSTVKKRTVSREELILSGNGQYQTDLYVNV
jgi:hypothetical protein